MFTGSYWSTHFFVIGHASQKWCNMPRKAMVVNAKQSQKFRDINLLISKLAKQSAIVMKMKDFDNIAVVNCLDMIWSGLTTMSSLQLWVEVIEKFPHWPFSQTELMSPWTHHVLFLFKSFLNHYIYHRHFRCCSSILSFDWSVKVRLMYLTVEFNLLDWRSADVAGTSYHLVSGISHKLVPQQYRGRPYLGLWNICFRSRILE